MLQAFTNKKCLIFASDLMVPIWESGKFFQTANVIQAPIRSVYPMQTNPNIQNDLNRIVWCKNENANSSQVMHLMQTPMQVGNNRPCHFVPLLKVVRNLSSQTFMIHKIIALQNI